MHRARGTAFYRDGIDSWIDDDGHRLEDEISFSQPSNHHSSETHPHNRRINRNRLPRHLRILTQLRIPVLILGAAIPTMTATANLRNNSIRRHRAHAQVTPRRYIVLRYRLDGGRRDTGCKRIAELGAKSDGLLALRDGDQRSRERRQRRVADWRRDRLPENRTG